MAEAASSSNDVATNEAAPNEPAPTQYDPITDKYYAATNKTAAGRSSAAITFTEAEKRTSSIPLAVTQPENVASTLVHQLSLYLQTNNHDYLKGMLKGMDDAASDLAASPYAANTGVVAFYDFEEDLSEDDRTM